MAIQLHSSFAVHPGIWLRDEIVQPHGLSVTTTAQKLGVTRQAMSNLLNGHASISAEMALRFEKAFDIKADTLLRMQVAHDMAAVRQHEQEIKVQRIKFAAA
ncbi:MAG: HigA family addiction module antidote protein [Gallionellaceae bacterium]|jgi:addiction module HigA family antidote|nr:HigA family addiction module antidote protein [Gallionellaceae bacterium]